MSGKLEKIIYEFFQSENQRDWENYERFLSDEVQWIIFSTEGNRIVKGKQDYLKTIQRIYENLSSTFQILTILSNEELGIVMAELEMENRRSVDVFEIKDGLIIREREYYDSAYWHKQTMQKKMVSIAIELDDGFSKAIQKLTNLLSSVENWAIDGSASLALQGIDLKPHDIDILTDEKTAYEIQGILREFMQKPVSRSCNGKYDSHFGFAIINGIKVEIMGDLNVFRNGHWSGIQNPSNCRIKFINFDGINVPVVSLEHQVFSGYFDERVRRYWSLHNQKSEK